MSIAGILSSSLFNQNSQAIASSQQSFQKEFQQLGQALQSGNLSAAQADFATLQQSSPSASVTAAGNSITQAFSQLGKDLQSGNLTAAQQDFSNIQQNVSSQGSKLTTIIIITAAAPEAASSPTSPRSSPSWARISRAATYPPRSRPTAPCSNRSRPSEPTPP
jgi:outer membrane protein assembly factor BamD (BamD/ComL family)